MSRPVTFAAPPVLAFGERSAAVSAFSPVFAFAITKPPRLHGLHDSEVVKQHEVVSLIGQPRTHELTFRKREGLRDALFTRAEQVLVFTGSGVQGIDERPFPLFLSDHDVAIFGNRAHRHHITITRRASSSGSAASWRFFGRPSVGGG